MRKLPYPREKAAYPRYHPPWPTPYAVVPKMRNYSVHAAQQSYLPGGKTKHLSGASLYHSPYVYEDPYLYGPDDTQYVTTKPLIDRIPYTYQTRYGSYNKDGHKTLGLAALVTTGLLIFCRARS